MSPYSPVNMDTCCACPSLSCTEYGHMCCACPSLSCTWYTSCVGEQRQMPMWQHIGIWKRIGMWKRIGVWPITAYIGHMPMCLCGTCLCGSARALSLSLSVSLSLSHTHTTEMHSVLRRRIPARQAARGGQGCDASQIGDAGKFPPRSPARSSSCAPGLCSCFGCRVSNVGYSAYVKFVCYRPLFEPQCLHPDSPTPKAKLLNTNRGAAGVFGRG